MAVGVDGEALGPGRCQVGIGLAGVAELELELGDQSGDRRPVAVQTLEDHGRAVVEQRQRLARVDQAGELPAGERRGARVRRLRQHRAVLGKPHRRGPDRGGGEQVVGVRERQQPHQIGRLGLVEVDAGRPDLGQEGLGVTAEQGESGQDASPSVVSEASPSVPSLSVPSLSPRAVAVATVVASPSVPSLSPPSVPSLSPCRRCRHRRCRRRHRPAAGRRSGWWSCRRRSAVRRVSRSCSPPGGWWVSAVQTYSGARSCREPCLRTCLRTCLRPLSRAGHASGRSPQPRCDQKHRACRGCWTRARSRSSR